MRLSERTLFPIILLCHPKLVEELGLTLPFDYQLRNDLSELGIETSKFDNPEELGRQLCQHSK